MKRYILTALALTAAALSAAPAAQANEVKTFTAQSIRYAALDRGGTKNLRQVEGTRLDILSNSTLTDARGGRLQPLDLTEGK
ncbi:hypothetical protein IQ241_17280 [Romeria aff. gracilis LEGE 07310]|uniref:Uncharacterized protein n=1 Tax=Vasconcelosia minhoensis LEGE 07310 TaxID=915328 RepID=A0A8J7DDQ2_9CYAN|nr:hypothetical protein [Romeria gracilis]MBE9079028.1 hypothetical protein [Romeria aff. gracilis LEGE 07310]